ncbi:MAG: 4Fe-4S dicluster domain-containing protein [Planctomycetota bacterium]|nr:MAG: 4Fe-4S dicluster domain-containing protein [Planctomycetota bacterium]
MRPYVDEEKCIACGTCAEVCPAEPVVFEVGDKSKVVHPEACTECEACVDNCPVQAIELKEPDE